MRAISPKPMPPTLCPYVGSHVANACSLPVTQKSTAAIVPIIVPMR